MSNILLGFEVGTGRRVEVPSEGHLACFGRTQHSGKTTALEGLVARGGFKAVAFITKRGESSFLTARVIPPFFSEPTNDPEQPLWRWVKSILEASQTRRMNFEESWIIRACSEPKVAKTLADVDANIAALLAGEHAVPARKSKRLGRVKWLRRPVSGINAGVYTSLKAYFDIVMPQLARLPYTKKLALGAGLNVMDLRDYSLELQALVIRSVMEHVYRHERNTRVIVPESQDFVPQGRNTPVKMACETMVRKGAADRNFMWLDSQDMAAVDKVMLRAVSILLCGVQGETHEIKRTIESMLGAGLAPEDVGRLRVGEFYVRAEDDVRKVYVMPAWMESEPHAQAIAQGRESVASAKTMMAAFKTARGNEEIHSDSNGADDADRPGHSATDSDASTSPVAVNPLPHGPVNADRLDASDGEDSMWKEKYEALKAEFDTLRDAHDKMAKRLDAFEHQQFESGYDDPEDTHPPRKGSAPSRQTKAAGNGAAGKGKAPAAPIQTVNGSVTVAELYSEFRKRILEEPAVLRVLAEKPSLELHINRPVIEMDASKLAGRIARLLGEGYFDQPKNGPALQKELERRGCKQPTTNLYGPLNKLAEQGFLTIESEGYKAVAGMKVHIHEAK